MSRSFLKDLTFFLNMIAEDWMKAKTERELHVMIKRAQYARILTMIGYVIMFVIFNLTVTLPLFGKSVRYITNISDPGKLLPLPTHYPYDKDRSPYFEFTFVAQSILGVIAAISYTGVDSLFGLLAFHLCGQMENFKQKLTDMKEFTTFNSGLTFLMQDHIRLIKLRVDFSISVFQYNLH